MAAEQTHDNPTDEDMASPVLPDQPEATAPQENGDEAVLSETAVTGEQEPQRPRIGPRILAVEAPSPPTPPAPKRGRTPRAPKPKAQQPRRRRRSPAERHRAVFFARLNELRRSGASQADATDEAQAASEGGADGTLAAEAPITSPEAEMPGQDELVAEGDAPGPGETVAEPDAPGPGEPVAEAVSEQPAGEEPPAPAVGEPPASEAAGQTGSSQGARRGASPPPVAPARVAAAIERVGGPGVVQEALAPKTDEQGERKKWAAVCCDAAQGSPPGDPIFTAWLRLAATPVREIKNHLPQPVDEARGGRNTRGRAGGSPREGGRGGRNDRERGSQRDRPSRDDMASYARGGRLTTKVRIVDREQEKREREQARKEQRERKRQAERERLDRLGY
ncbi:MAG TPA: hypothetical protein VGV40_03175 [Solirubrobacteraceae bacterium]|nr:hypothetical protein [Solirubrobacteraceae bacterium]